MEILSKLKSLLSKGQSRPPTPTSDTPIPVEEPDPPTKEQENTIEQGDESTGTTEPDQSVQPNNDPVETINGIGPSYADQLGNAGIKTVSDLATADASELAEETGISKSRITSWIDLANTT